MASSVRTPRITELQQEPKRNGLSRTGFPSGVAGSNSELRGISYS